MSLGGSSPLTRGKPRRGKRPRGRQGLIHAHAGKTTEARRSPGRHRAHPRSRGENQANGLIVTPHEGSSPLTRGKHRIRIHLSGSDGLIPAHAGKTSLLRTYLMRNRAHPRSRGENLHACIPDDYQPGSSPLTRGKPLGRVRDSMRARLIPAHAGKTRPYDLLRQHHWAHPRSRGENNEIKDRLNAIAGSSPLTRGKREISQDEFNRRGLIPAHAGKTLANEWSC